MFIMRKSQSSFCAVILLSVSRRALEFLPKQIRDRLPSRKLLITLFTSNRSLFICTLSTYFPSFKITVPLLNNLSV